MTLLEQLSHAVSWLADPAHLAGILVAVLLIAAGTWAVLA